MQIKLLEVQDRATCISVIAIRPSCPSAIATSGDDDAIKQAQFLLGKAGFKPWHNDAILFAPLAGGQITANPFDHGGGRTMQAAHRYAEQHWDTLKDGSIIDVRVTSGEEPDRAVRSDAFWDRP